MMSSAPAGHVLSPAPQCPGGVHRRHLRVVGPQERRAARPARPEAGRLRITRRGRLAVTGAVTLLLALVVATLAAAALSAGATPTESYLVQPGETLSQIAAVELPELPLDRAMTQIQLTNEMGSLHVQAGQRLEIPRP